MSNRRHLVSRARMNNEAPASPAPSQSRAAPRQNTELPLYQPPECPMTENQQHALGQLQTNHNYTKYIKNLKVAMNSVIDAAASTNDRLHESKLSMERAARKRKREGRADADLNEEELEQQRHHKVLEKKVQDITADAEKALRELIDFEDEQCMSTTHLTEMIDAIKAAAPLRNQDDDDEDEDEVGVISATELYKKIKADYATGYNSKSKLAKYGDHNEYGAFKRVLHDSKHQGEESAPEVPRSVDWFPEEKAKSGSRRRGDHANSSDSDDVVIERAVQNFKCPLSMRYFVEPVTAPCGHTFNKEDFLSYFTNADIGIGARQGPNGKEVKCPETGCSRFFKKDEPVFNKVIMRQVERAKKRDAQAAEEDEDEDDDLPRGGQSRRPQQLSDGDDDVDDEETAASQAKRVKSERMSRGPSSARSRGRHISEDEDEDVDMDD